MKNALYICRNLKLMVLTLLLKYWEAKELYFFLRLVWSDVLRLVLAHEISHAFLKHESPIFVTAEEFYAQEIEADKLEAEWLKMNPADFRAVIGATSDLEVF